MIRYGIVLALALACYARTGWAQPGDLTPELSMRLLVEVQSTSLDPEGRPEPTLPAAGTILGERNDTLYVVTSHHHVKSAARVEVRIRSDGPLLPAAVRFEHDSLDFAVLAVTGHSADPSWRLPRRVPRKISGIEFGETVFMIGCPEGKCWSTPERGKLSGSTSYTVQFRTYYIKPGVSGGPLVDSDGALMGMIVVRHEVAEGTAVWWPTIASIARSEGFPTELPVERGYRVGDVSVRAFGAILPGPGTNLWGGSTLGARLEVGARIAPRVELAGGATLLAFKASPYILGVDDAEEYNPIYFHVGARYSRPLTRWSFSRRLPDVFTAGADLLFPSGSNYVVGTVDSDSVDLSTGEYVKVRGHIDVPAGLSVAGRFSYRVALTEQFGVLLAPSFYILVFQDTRINPLRGSVEVGLDFRG